MGKLKLGKKMPSGQMFYTIAELKTLLKVKEVTLGRFGVFITK